MGLLRQSLLGGVLLLSSVYVLYQGWALYRIHQENAWIEQLLQGHDIQLEKLTDARPEVRLARAVYLRQKLRYDEALATLSLIIEQGGSRLQAQTRYNLGNVYLAQAVAEAEAMKINEALPMAGLAKQAYRDALALDSQFWDAKYNLEVAMRLLPEMDRINTGDEGSENEKTQLWTTVPGFPRGLP